MNKELEKYTELLFSYTYGVNYSEVSEKMHIMVDNLISKYGWDTVFESWNNYLFRECKTEESVINFAHLFWNYTECCEYPIKEPFKFLAYFFYRIDFDIDKDVDGIIDSLACRILEVAKYEPADLYVHPYYIPELDPNIIAEAEVYKSQNL
jgi:hypothetical protein